MTATRRRGGTTRVFVSTASTIQIDELKRRGVTIVSQPHDVAAMGLRVAFFADPWGNLFEVIQSISN